MSTLTYSVSIKTFPEVVWQNLWNDKSYRKWTAMFMEGSYAESTWEQGAKISFLTPGKNGMFGVIEKKIENEEMSFKHLGEIKNGIEENKDWGNAMETYFLKETQDGTLLTVTLTMDESNEKYEQYFNDVFPKALSVLKQLCENHE